MLVGTTRSAESPIEWSHQDHGSAWVCDFVKDWKAILRRDFPDADRSVPLVERRCHLPRETIG